jgi:hypothetical protein
MEELSIAGIPAKEWVGRRVRFWGYENKQHPTPCLIMGFDGRKVIIKPIGHKHTELMPIECIAPTWKNNDDLRQKYNVVVDSESTQPHDADEDQPTPEEITPEVTVVEQPPVTEVEAPAEVEQPPAQHNPSDDIRQPRMIISNHNVEWMPTYQRYLAVLRAEATDRALLQEVLSAISIHCEEQSKLVQELKLLGVEVIDDVPCGHVESPILVTNVTDSPDSSGRRGRIAIDRMVLDWARDVKRKLQNGETVVGTIGSWATHLNVSHKTIQTRLDMLGKVMKLSFTDGQGRTGNKCKQRITVKLK